MLPTPHRRRHARLLRAAPAALALLTLLGGCGSSAPRRLDLADASSLQGTLAAVRASAQQGNRGAVLEGLAALRARVERLEASGALAAVDARGLRAQIARALAAAQRELPPPPVVVEAPPAVEQPPDHAHKRSKGHGHHRGEVHPPDKHGSEEGAGGD